MAKRKRTSFRRKFRKRSTKKRRFYRARRGGGRRKFLPLTGFTKSKIVKLRYCEEIKIDASLDTLARYIYRANDLYDPNQTGTGHQPRGFDQNMLFFNHFTVVGSKINVRYVPHATGSVTPGILGIVLSADGNTTTNATSTQDLLETKAFGKNYTFFGSVNGPSSNYRTISKGFSSKKFFGVKNTVGKDLYRGNDTTSPTEQAHYEIVVAPVAGNNPGDASLIVTIDYIAVLTEPKQIVGS